MIKDQRVRYMLLTCAILVWLILAAGIPSVQAQMNPEAYPLRGPEVHLQEEGFAGKGWGTVAGRFPGARKLADVGDDLSVYAAAADLSPIFGNAESWASPRLVFAKQGGLQKWYVAFEAGHYAAVEGRLTELLGAPAPIVYELWAGRMDFIDRAEWRISRETRLVLTLRLSGACLEMERRAAAVPGGRQLEDMVTAAMLKEAKALEKQEQLLAASTIYQQLLNITGAYRSFTRLAQERLAAYSRLEDTSEFLHARQGVQFRGLKSSFPDGTGQFWLRMDFAPSAREAWLQRQPDNTAVTDTSASITAALCRVQAVPGQGFRLLEQVWLDDSDSIVGGRTAASPQDSGWPGAFVKESCESFLQQWFTANSQPRE